MPGGDTLWYCHSCNTEMRPVVMTPEPLCASCNSSFVEELPGSDVPNEDDPRTFNAMGRLFEQASMTRDRGERDGVDPTIGLAIDPVSRLLGAVLGMRNLGPESSSRSPLSGSPEAGPSFRSGQSTINIRRGSWNRETGPSQSNFNFSFRTGGGSGHGGIFGGFGRREERQERQEPPGLDELLASLMTEGPNTNQGENRGQDPSTLQHILMGIFGAGIGQPGVGTGNGRWGDYVLNQEALDQIITQLMDANHAAPVPVPEEMISTWPRTILTPDNPLENQDCAVCKESFKYEPPEPNLAQPESNKLPEPQEAVTLPCKHSFHVECIEPWVKVKGTCPVCRFELVPQGGQQNSNPSSSGSGGNASAGSNSGPDRRNSGGNNNENGGTPVMPGAYYELD